MTSGNFAEYFNGDATFLVLNADGTGSLYATPFDDSFVVQTPILYVDDGSILSMQVIAYGEVTLLQYSFSDGDTLTLSAGVSFDSATLVRTNSVGDLATGQITSATLLVPDPTLAPINFFGYVLTNDGATLQYATQSAATGHYSVASFDPTSQTTSLVADISTLTGNGNTFNILAAVVNSDYWLTCWCNPMELELWAPGQPNAQGTRVDEFAPPSDVSEFLYSTWDGSDLWFITDPTAGQDEALVEIETASHPDSETRTFPLHTSSYGVTGLAYQDDHLWMLVNFFGYTLIEIDPSTGAFVNSYAMPASLNTYDTSLSGLTSLNGKMYAWYQPSGSALQIVELSGFVAAPN